MRQILASREDKAGKENPNHLPEDASLRKSVFRKKTDQTKINLNTCHVSPLRNPESAETQLNHLLIVMPQKDAKMI
nr:hypothetical protein HmN_000480500 [Hymenolepis microstoma]